MLRVPQFIYKLVAYWYIRLFFGRCYKNEEYPFEGCVGCEAWLEYESDFKK